MSVSLNVKQTLITQMYNEMSRVNCYKKIKS